MPSSAGSSRPRDRTHVSYISGIGTQILYRWSLWQAQLVSYTDIKLSPNDGVAHYTWTVQSAGHVACERLLPSWESGVLVPDRQMVPLWTAPVTDCCCSITNSCPTLWNPENCSTLGFPVLHCLPEFAQTHVHWGCDAIQPYHPLSSPSPPPFNLSQRQGLFQWVGSLHQVELQHQPFQWIFRADLL